MYVTEGLRLITENTAKNTTGNYIKTRYMDIVHPKPEETRTADEIIGKIKGKLAKS